MNQNEIAVTLIKNTLYQGQKWTPVAETKGSKIHIVGAKTVWHKQIVKIRFNRNKITLNGKRLHVSKELSSDVAGLSKLMLFKILNLKHVPKNKP
jgi:hypothetical protein